MAIGLNFGIAPRYMGNPHQVRVNTTEQILDWLNDNNGQKACFTSLYTYDNDGNVLIDKTWHDLDPNNNKLEKAIVDMRALAKWCCSVHIPYVPVVTGGKGGHFYGILKPEWLPKEEAKKKLSALQIYMVRKNEIRTYCRTTTGKGNVRQMVRVPQCNYSRYDKKKNEWTTTDYTTIPINDELLFDSNVKIVREASLNGTDYNFVRDDEQYPTISELVDKLKLSWKNIENTFVNLDDRTGVYAKYEYKDDRLLKRLFPKPCVHNSLASGSPHFEAKIYVLVHMKYMGKSPTEIFNFLKNINDVEFKADETERQINYLYNTVPEYRYPSCRSFKSYGMCIGPSCPHHIFMNGEKELWDKNRRDSK